MRILLSMLVLAAAVLWTMARPEAPTRRPVRGRSRVVELRTAPTLRACPAPEPAARAAEAPMEVVHAFELLDRMTDWTSAEESPWKDDLVGEQLVEAVLAGRRDAEDAATAGSLARLANGDGPIEVRAGALAALECVLRHGLVDEGVRTRIHDEAARRGL